MSLRKFYLESNGPVLELKQQAKKILPYSVYQFDDKIQMSKWLIDLERASCVDRRAFRDKAMAAFLKGAPCVSPSGHGAWQHDWRPHTKWLFFTYFKCHSCGSQSNKPKN